MCGGVILYIHSFLFLVCKGEASYPYSFQVISMPRVGFLKQVRIGKLSVLLAKKKRKKKNRQTGKKKKTDKKGKLLASCCEQKNGVYFNTFYTVTKLPYYQN